VDSELTPENKHIALKLDGHYFICANNGILSLIASEFVAEKIVEINIHDKVQSNFPVLDVFVKVAGHLARGGTLEVIGKTIPEIRQLKEMEPLINPEQNQIKGNVIYIDNYGNVVTNIPKKLFEKVGKGRRFSMRARTATFNEIYSTYSEAINFDTDMINREDGKKLAIFNSGGYIELAIYKSNPSTVGSASTLLGLEYRDTVTVNFE
jgi:S-adenosylmethionine hydrolase